MEKTMKQSEPTHPSPLGHDQQKEPGKSHHACVRALAFKRLRIIFRCWKDGKP
jgi:hypothetical protein